MNRHTALALALVALASLQASADAPTPSHDDSFSPDGLFKANVATLKDTQLVVHPDVPLPANTNVLWCGTFQLAWNKAIDLVGEKLHFTTQPPIVTLLNREDCTEADLAPESYVAMADFERNHVEDEIRAALKKTFGGAASPELIPQPPKHPGSEDFVAYAYLYKNLAFAIPFKDHHPLYFNSQPVESFGFSSHDTDLPTGAIGQVLVYDYKSADDFIVQLKTKSVEDELILAKIEPGATLQATIQSVLDRMSKNPAEAAIDSDNMFVPKLNFDLRRDINEVIGLILNPSASAHVHGGVITEAKQLVRFQLNEKGAILKSEAVIAIRATAIMPHRSLIFDHPFLILMKQKNSSRPYFALWVGNASLLIPAKTP